MRKVFLRLKKTAGESLAETLVALLITCMGLVILPGAITAASKVTMKTKEASMTSAPTTETAGEVTIDGETITSCSKMIYKSDDDNELAYYYYTVETTD